MRIYNIAFYLAGFFILGVLGASSGLNFPIIIMATILMAAVFSLIGYFKKSPKFFGSPVYPCSLFSALFIIFGGIKTRPKALILFLIKKLIFRE